MRKLIASAAAAALLLCSISFAYADSSTSPVHAGLPTKAPAAPHAGKRATAPPTATLTWTNVTQYSDGTAIPGTVTVTYNIYQGPTATSLVKVATGVTALTSSITTGLSDGQTYFWAVTAVANGLEGLQSNVGTKTFTAVPPGTTSLTVN